MLHTSKPEQCKILTAYIVERDDEIRHIIHIHILQSALTVALLSWSPLLRNPKHEKASI